MNSQKPYRGGPRHVQGLTGAYIGIQGLCSVADSDVQGLTGKP